jgi:predicted nucleic acid-binding protein
MAADSIFLDTNLLVAASAEAHPSHAMATALVARLVADRVPMLISVQVCREFLSVMTRAPLGAARPLTVAEALAALDTWRGPCVVLREDDAVLSELIALVRKYDVKGTRHLPRRDRPPGSDARRQAQSASRARDHRIGSRSLYEPQSPVNSGDDGGRRVPGEGRRAPLEASSSGLRLAPSTSSEWPSP